ncbi:hypothetical protein [Sphingomonas abaci]|uniref:Uncharacterized protein n=1 Tax=Sphingomonas abaci TaxID=237611 RepID=A0A7W7F0V8_9SPHN|nr:hypothetical protein [Sphingomonas abaci]MBB4618755.1 hypothetical protein [Sphingomonas abaci]
MRKISIVAAVAATFTATVATAAPLEHRFTHEGQTYVYTADEAHGAKVISGHRVEDGKSFRLVVRNGRVTGRSGEAPVAFRVADAAGAAKDATSAL